MKDFFRKTMVRSADYELYRIFLPWRFAFSRRRNFIISELEKMHPRFSGNCCYDTKYCVERKNLLAEVVVMEKASLAAYKSSGGALYLEGQAKRSVFSWRTNTIRFLALFLIVLAALLSFRIAKSVLFAQKSADEVYLQIAEDAATKPEVENNADINIGKKSSSSVENLLSSVFLSVSSHGGKISSFSYRKNDLISKAHGGGVCSFSVYGCNCEDVANAQYCVVSFKDNEPRFEMVLPFTESDSLMELPLRKNSFEEEISFVVGIRKGLRDLGAVFDKEHNGDDCVEFSFFARREILYSCLKTAGLVAENAGWAEKLVSVSENGGMCKVQLSFLKNTLRDSFSPVLLAAQYAYLFGSEPKLAKKEQKLFQAGASRSGAVKASEKSLLKNKIGEIKKDGSVFICYRNMDGRMAFEKKESVNAN